MIESLILNRKEMMGILNKVLNGYKLTISFITTTYAVEEESIFDLLVDKISGTNESKPMIILKHPEGISIVKRGGTEHMLQCNTSFGNSFRLCNQIFDEVLEEVLSLQHNIKEIDDFNYVRITYSNKYKRSEGVFVISVSHHGVIFNDKELISQLDLLSGIKEVKLITLGELLVLIKPDESLVYFLLNGGSTSKEMSESVWSCEYRNEVLKLLLSHGLKDIK